MNELMRILPAVALGTLPLLVFCHFFGSWWQEGLSVPYIGVFLTVCAVFAAVVLAMYKVLGLNALFMQWFSRRSKASE